jgi:hypothetical protein
MIKTLLGNLREREQQRFATNGGGLDCYGVVLKIEADDCEGERLLMAANFVEPL